MGFPIPPGFNPASDTEKFLSLYISTEAWESRSGADILASLRESGWEIRTQRFYEVRREALSLTKFQEQIQRLKPSSLIPEAWTTEQSKWELSDNYLYQLEVVGESISGHEMEVRHYSFYAKQRLELQEIETSILDLIGEHAKQYDFNVHDARVVRVIGDPARFER